MLNIAVFAPMPRASVRIATEAKAGLFLQEETDPEHPSSAEEGWLRGKEKVAGQ